MNSLYHNQEVATALRGVGPVDRWVRSVGRTLEHVVSLSVATLADGSAVRVLTAEAVEESGLVVASAHLGTYPLEAGPQAFRDGEAAAVLLKIRLRVLTASGGWDWAYDPDDHPEVHRPPLAGAR